MDFEGSEKITSLSGVYSILLFVGASDVFRNWKIGLDFERLRSYVRMQHIACRLRGSYVQK